MTHETRPPPPEIRVKVLSAIPAAYLQRQLPSGIPVWGRCRFSFDPADDHYDWLVVYDDLPARRGEPRRQRFEPLACPAAHTLLTTSEPPSIKHYGNAYVRQFGCVITSQPPWALPHPDRVYSQAGLHWFYGLGRQRMLGFDALAAHPPLTKTRMVSMMFTPKRMRHTLHHRRFRFLSELMHLMPEIDAYGRGARALEDDDKAHALNAYRYHITAENYIGPHHWTEKLADAFLGVTLPFYAGCPNAADYFPSESFIPIDLRDPAGAARIIRAAIANDEYEKRLPAILEARRRVLFEYNYFALVAREIEKRHRPDLSLQPGRVIYSRHALRRLSPAIAIRDALGKTRARVIHLLAQG